ncbi:MAG: hypothetical protein U0401_32305 [Anaerolineae bacterium]
MDTLAYENNSNKLGSTAAPQSGVSSIQSKLTGIVGRAAGSINRSRGMAATRTLVVVDSVDMPGSIDTLTPVAAAGALIVGNDDPVRLAKRAIKPGTYFQPDMSEDELVRAEER